MNSLSFQRISSLTVSRIHFEVTFFHEFTSNLLSFSRFHFEFTFYFAKRLSMHTLFREFTFKLLLMLYFFREFTSNSLFYARIYFEFPVFPREFTFVFKNTLSISHIHFECIIVVANALRIHYFFANSSWINYLYREILFNALSFSPIYYEFTMILPDLRSFHNQFRIFSSYSLFLSWIHHEFTIFSANFLSMQYHFRESTLH